ncbi:MAG: hypothetical protein VB078_07890 [Clostridiaceae bacterium]|nr:hypothetical protein [Clostridiaceae bacterium]
MSIFDKFFKKQASSCPAKQPNPVQSQTQDNNLTDAGRNTKNMSPDEYIRHAQSLIPNERIEYYFAIKDKIDDSWTPQQKAKLCCSIAGAARAGLADARYREGNLGMAFYASQLYYDPDPNSLGWSVFRHYGFNKATAETAARLHEAYPLPKNIDEAQNYSVPILTNAEPKAQNGEGKKIRHIVCLCYDAPYINSLKPQMQDFILKAEQSRGSVLTPASRITFDSFYDNASLEQTDMIRQKLQQIYVPVYQQNIMYELADKTVAREVQQKDGHTLVKYFVLYEG